MKSKIFPLPNTSMLGFQKNDFILFLLENREEDYYVNHNRGA